MKKELTPVMVSPHVMMRMLWARMGHMVSGTYNVQDPTHFEHGTQYVISPGSPLKGITEEEAYSTCQFLIEYKDVTWGIDVKIYKVLESTNTRVFKKEQIAEAYFDNDRGLAERATPHEEFWDILQRLMCEPRWEGRPIEITQESEEEESDPEMPY